METNLTAINDNIKAMTQDPAGMARIWVEVMNAKTTIAAAEKRMKGRMLELMTEADINRIELGNGVIVSKTEKKKDRFDTPTVYKAIGITDEQAKYLPKNPAFRKTAVLANPDTAVAYSEEMTESAEFDLKEVDTEMLKALGLWKK